MSEKPKQDLLATDQEVHDKNDTEGADDYPEGGLRAWFVVFAAMTIMAMSFGMVNSFGVYQSYYETRYSTTSSTKIGAIGSIQAGLTFMMGIPSTMGGFYLGPQMMVLFGGVLCIIAFMLLSVTNAIWQVFLVQALLYGMGSGIMYIHSTSVTFQYFHRKKALAQGLITAGASAGGVYWPIGVRGLINTIGFGWGTRTIGFIYIPMTIFATAFIRPRFKPTKRQPDQNIFRLDFSVLKHWQLQVMALAWFEYIMCLFTGLFYYDLFCQRLDTAEYLQKYVVAIINGCGLVARVLPGYIGDKLGRLNLSFIFLVFTGVLPLAMWTQVRSTPGILAFSVVWGFFSGAPTSLLPAVVGQIFPSDEVPSCLAYFYACGGVASFIGPSIAGTFIPRGDIKGAAGFTKLAIFSGVFGLASAASVLVVRLQHSRNPLKKL